MRLNSTRHRSKAIGLTALIDVVFLLLIFFMLASTFLSFSSLPISGAQAGSGATSATEIALIQVAGNSDITINGRQVPITTLALSINDLVSKGISQAVVQTLDGGRVQDLVTVLEICRKSDVKNVIVVE